ncbi:lysophospholipid acyltransferase family protein [Catenuloplanes japonicus]|uniref:lysophospholipid acyltransferase family protein n=1 Tax=Catenuloplanes japonicus TaxID=33876 RepID=UPI00052783F3|nr:lysophospholipid acyltransferase family protein [Catenuloplanes japonicus]
MLRLLSYLYWTIIAITCPIFFVGALLVWAATVLFDRRKVVLHLYSSAWAVFYVRLNPLWRLRTTGRELLPRKGAAVLVANHASLIDILVLFDLFRPFKWVSKSEIFKVPFVGWNMWLNGYVPLVRGSGESVRRMMTRCGQLLDQGIPVLLFPEGRRSEDGHLQKFKDGAFELAVRHHAPVYPIAVHGTGRALPKHGLVLRAQINARVEVLPPLHPTDFPDTRALRDAAHTRIAEALDQHP